MSGLRSQVVLPAGRLAFLTGIGASVLFLAAQSAPADTIYVDACAPGDGDGSAGNPYNTLTRAVAEAPPGDTIVMQGGFYAETLVITKELTITASYGPEKGGEAMTGCVKRKTWCVKRKT